MKTKYLTTMNLLSTALLILLLTSSCYKEELIVEESSITPGEGLADWTTETHSDDAIPDYDMVFPQDQVNRIDILISPDDWESKLDDLTDHIGDFGSGGGDVPPPPMFGSVIKGMFPEPPPGGEDFTPVFSEASIYFNGIEWYHVGVRFKGNSSLRSAWQSGIMKLAFRFDFDEFEDDHPEIKNQRFYGFQKLSFSNNFNDQSFLHEKLAADVFRDAGIKAPKTAYYRIYVDYGNGPIYFGLYTAVEIVEDTMLEDQFGNGEGNCYKPEGNAATFAYGTFNSEEFDLKTNDDLHDYSDVEALYDIINSSLRTSNVEQWKDELESVFDVDNFMHWLAVNTVIQNWDTYGIMNHNYYLYHNPYTNKLVWIPWDNNEALTEGLRETLSLSMIQVNDDWPLIRYLIDIPEYETIYNEYLNSTINGAFEPNKLKETYEYYHNLISDYVIGVDGEQPGFTFLPSSGDFTNSLTEQNNHVEERYTVVEEYLSE
ncbi:MAG: spore coat protein [Marinilabiliales bacterium]|nr:MAG: spore coat protein [Marinilabiliales bacterium]